MAEPKSLRSLAKMIDHSLLHPTVTDRDLAAGCETAVRHDVATVCVKPSAVRDAARRLEGSTVGVCAVVAFPHGNATTAIKVSEARQAMDDGAKELDMVVNVGKVLSGDWEFVSADIGAVNDAAVAGGAIVKVIFENDFLADGHILTLCKICTARAVAFVKTSTGYGFVKQPDGRYDYRGATEHHVKLMRANCPDTIGVKAAGGIRTFDDFLRFVELGVTRIGATATETILREAARRGWM